MTVSVAEARDILGKDAEGMTDEQIQDVIITLDLMAKDALESARKALRMKRDTKAMAELIYDIYQDRRRADNNQSPNS